MKGFMLISKNMEPSKVQDNIKIFAKIRDNILIVSNKLSVMPEGIRNMPSLTEKMNEELVNAILPRCNFWIEVWCSLITEQLSEVKMGLPIVKIDICCLAEGSCLLVTNPHETRESLNSYDMFVELIFVILFFKVKVFKNKKDFHFK